ncbi:unnamed protein product, partial [Ectocarpus sp. 8 AP-2014]
FVLQPTASQSVLGGFLDPLADKVMVTTVALALGQQGIVPTALVVRKVLREMGGERG